MALTKIGSIGINTGIQFAGVTTIATLNASDNVLSVGGTVNFTSDVSIGGSVSIGGTLTYEDVTNIDSVGLITARQGIEIGTGVGVAASISVDGNAEFAGIVTASTSVSTLAKVGGGVTISESGIEASGIGITVANINGSQISGRRNIIINGAINVAQRAASATSVSGEYKTVDRFSVSFGGADEAPTEAQHDLSSSDTPYSLGFRKSFHLTNGNQTGGAGSSDYLQPQYKIEAQDIACLLYTSPSPRDS